MSDEDVDNYPKLAKYVRYSMPQVLRVPLIVANIKKFGNLSRDQFQYALTWGCGPKIVIKALDNFQCVVRAANGCFDPANPDQIELDTSTCDDFEGGNSAALDLNAAGRHVYIVGTTMLHELCHWGNHKAGVVESTEQGVAFEVATYGRNTG